MLVNKHQDGKLYLICPLTSGRFFVRFMLESKGTSKYCGDRTTSGLMQEIHTNTSIFFHAHTLYHESNAGSRDNSSQWVLKQNLGNTTDAVYCCSSKRYRCGLENSNFQLCSGAKAGLRCRAADKQRFIVQLFCRCKQRCEWKGTASMIYFVFLSACTLSVLVVLTFTEMLINLINL